MSSPHGLVTLVGEPDPAQGATVLLHNLTGFLDAGAAGKIAVDSLLAALPSAPVAEFDIDAVYDYRARRPRMTFLTDHYGEIELPSLRVDRLTDLAGTEFLVLHGPEPDFRWRAFAQDTLWLIDHLGVDLTIGLHAVPWPAPHTRPVNVTSHGTNPELLADPRQFVGDLEVPAHAAGLLELTLGDAGHTALGFAAHVPHYLAGARYPRASIALLNSLAVQTGLQLPLDALREQAQEADDEIAGQLSAEPENLEAVHMLEQQYDDFMARLEHADDQAPDISDLDPKDFVDQVERFLAGRENDQDH